MTEHRCQNQNSGAGGAGKSLSFQELSAMAIVKWDPLRELRLMQEQMNRLFDQSRERNLAEPFEEGGWVPPVDIYEDGEAVVVKLEVPEVKQEAIDVQIEGNSLVISGERHLDQAAERPNYHRIERGYGPFRRSFTLPAGVDPEGTKASFEGGILKVVLPKLAAAGPRQITVKVEG